MDLERRLRDGPATIEHWQVYGDLLLERGDPRGELVALGIAAERTTSASERRRIERRLAALSTRIDLDLVLRAQSQPAHFRLDWRYGFVERARVVEPADCTRIPALAWLEDLLTAGASRFLRTLEIDREQESGGSFGAPGRPGAYEWAEPAFAATSLPQLRSLRIGAKAANDLHLSETSSAMVAEQSETRMTGRASSRGARIARPNPWIGDVSTALLATPCLEELRLTGEGVCFTALPATLRSLTIETRFLKRSTLRAIGSANLPKLESLELWLGHWPDSLPRFDGPEGEAYYGPATGPADLQALLSGERLGALQRLALSNCAWMPELVLAVATSAIAPQLESLDFSYGFMNGAQAMPLLAHAERLRHLSRLDLSHNQIDDETGKRLRDAFGDALVLDPQEELEGSAVFRLLSF